MRCSVEGNVSDISTKLRIGLLLPITGVDPEFCGKGGIIYNLDQKDMERPVSYLKVYVGILFSVVTKCMRGHHN